MDGEVLLTQPHHFLQPRFVAAHGRRVRRFGELRLQRRPQAGKPAVEQGRGEAIEGKPAAAFFDDEPRFFEQAQMARHARLRDAEHGGQLGHVQPAVLSREHAQQAQTHLVAQQPVELAGLSSHT